MFDFQTLSEVEFATLGEADFGSLVWTLSEVLSSSSSESSSGSSNSSSGSSLSSASSLSSDSSPSTRSSESSDASEKPALDPIPVHNRYPSLFINDDDPGLVSKIDEIAYRYIEVRTIRGPVTVEMESSYANSEIRYTLNGKNPNPSSHLYTGPLTFRQNASGSERTTIKARVYDKRNANNKSKIIRLEFRVI